VRAADGRLPIHVAAASGAPPAAVRKLLECARDTLHITDPEGRTPMQIAIVFGAPAGVLSVMASVDHDRSAPQARTAEEKGARSLLELAAAVDAPRWTVHELLDAEEREARRLYVKVVCARGLPIGAFLQVCGFADLYAEVRACGSKQRTVSSTDVANPVWGEQQPSGADLAHPVWGEEPLIFEVPSGDDDTTLEIDVVNSGFPVSRLRVAFENLQTGGEWQLRREGLDAGGEIEYWLRLLHLDGCGKAPSLNLLSTKWPNTKASEEILRRLRARPAPAAQVLAREPRPSPLLAGGPAPSKSKAADTRGAGAAKINALQGMPSIQKNSLSKISASNEWQHAQRGAHRQPGCTVGSADVVTGGCTVS
jgi:hypothetical protein